MICAAADRWFDAGCPSSCRVGCLTSTLSRDHRAVTDRTPKPESSSRHPEAERTDCTNADELLKSPERLLDVEWAPSAFSVLLVAIQVEALDRHRPLSDMTKVLADERVNILSTSPDRVGVSRFSFEMGDPKHLGHVLKAVRSVEGVYDVYRVTSAS